MRNVVWGVCLFVISLTTGLFSEPVHAIDAQSTNYSLSESSIGAGSSVQSSSTNYKSSDAAGDTAVGNATSTNFQTNSGTKTPNDPNLSVSINTGSVNFPAFSAAATATATATFSVLNYTSYGYVVQIAGTAPTNAGANKTIPAMSSTQPSQTGVEQFGINLVANTSPSSFGSNPDNGGYGFGTVAPNYNTPNSFRFVNGETIALSSKNSGQTNYTISYIVNVAGLTPGGQYTSNQTLIVTGTY